MTVWQLTLHLVWCMLRGGAHFRVFVYHRDPASPLDMPCTDREWVLDHLSWTDRRDAFTVLVGYPHADAPDDGDVEVYPADEVGIVGELLR